MPSTPSQKPIDVWRSAPTSVMWWTPWLWSLRIDGTVLSWTPADPRDGFKPVGAPAASETPRSRSRGERAHRDGDGLTALGGEADGDVAGSGGADDRERAPVEGG